MQNASEYFDSLPRVIMYCGVHDFWAQIAIVALLQGYDDIAMSSHLNWIVQQYINPRTR